MDCPKSPMWESEGEALSEDESVSACGSRASGCMGLVARSLFLQDWEAKVALSCMAPYMLCQELHEAWSGDATERHAVTA